VPESPELPDLTVAPGEFMRVLGLDLDEVSGSRVTGSLGASLHVSDRDQFAVGVNNSTDFIRSAAHGRLDVVAVPVQQGRVQQLWDVTLRSGDTLIARGTVRLQNVPLSRAK
jgi:hypothetical protein